MTELFTHTPQTTDVVNQVENLATEVNDAFVKVEDILFQDDQKNASINSSIGDLDNKYIKEYVPNKGWILNYSQNLYFPTNSQSASLDLYPSFTVVDLNTVSIKNLTSPSVTYEYQHSGTLTNDTDFTFVDKKVILGKPPTESDNLVITYKGFNTTTPDDTADEWPFELKYNVLQIKNFDNSITREFEVQSSGGVYTVNGYNFKSLCSTFIQEIINNGQQQDLDKYVSVYFNEKRVDAFNYEITNTFFRFASEETITGKIKIYVANSSLGKLVECLYRLFYAHDHGSNGGNGVNHNSILGLYENTDAIKYQSTNKSNYDHPQYLNREGYITDSTVYNNGFLGDLLLTSTSDNNRKNNLDSNSVKLIFGEYNSGSRMYYNSADDCLWLDSISRDGIKLVSPRDKKILSLNDHSFVDTQYTSSNTNKALKLTLRSDNDQQLGVFQLTRKTVVDGIATDDDKAKLLSYASEFSLSLIKEQLVIDNGAKITFGNPGIIDLVLDDTGLHFKTDGDGELTDISTIHFDVPVNAKKINVDHLDAKSLHLTDTQRIDFGSASHTDNKTQYINYTDKLNLKTEKAVNFASNGRQTGLSIDGRHYIYAATAQGFPILDQVEYTDLFIETKRDTYFIQTGYTYNPGVTSLHDVPKANTYCDTSFVNTLAIQYNESSLNGILLNSNNKIFAQRDLTDNISTILQSNSGVIIASSYNPVGPVINYGKITAKTFVAEGSKDTDAGFYGNIIVPINNRLTINGTTEFNSDITFNKSVTFTDKVTANVIDAQTVNTNNLNVSDKATYNNVEVLEELRFNTMLQTNRTANSEFEGTVQFNNNVTMPDSNNLLIIGNKEIEDTRKVSGLMLSANKVTLGTNGVLEAGKVFATKGTPSGNGDTTGGYSFGSTNGVPDGDTGFFAEENIEEQSNSDLVFRIDGQERGRFFKEPLDLGAIDLSGKEKAIVTLDILLDQISNLTSNTLATVYPIGTVYQNTIDGRNPAVILNWPTSVWKKYAIGRSIVGAEGTGVNEKIDTDLNKPAGLDLMAIGTKYGDYVHKLTKDENAEHYHGYIQDDTVRDHAEYYPDLPQTAWDVTNTANRYGPSRYKTTTEGKGQAHNNTHPIIVTYVWERIG